MKRKGGNKNIMTLSKEECLIVYKQYLANADSKFNDAITLSNSGSFGSATSHLIISLEETMKAVVLYLDGNGFEFRSRVRGIKNLFENHQLRYFLAIILSVFNIFIQDFMVFIKRIRKDHKEILKLKPDDKNVQKQLMSYVQEKIKNIIGEIAWFSKADLYRQDGFYVDYVDEVKTPLSVNEEEFSQVKIRVENLRKIASEFLLSFTSEDKEITEHIQELKKQFIREGWYEGLSKLIDKTKDSNTNPFEILASSLSEFESELNEFPGAN